MTKTHQIVFFILLMAACVSCASPSAEFHYTLGRQYLEAGEPVKAMRSFIAATQVPSGEYIFKGRSYSNMATMCRKGERHDLAYALYDKSLEQFTLADDSLRQAYALNNMAWEKAVQSDKKYALELIDSALLLSRDSALLAKVLESRIAAHLYASEYDSVLLYTARIASPSVYIHMVRAQAFALLAENDSAVIYARHVLERTDNPRYLDDVYYILTQCDPAAVVEDLRQLSSQRTDVQRTLERNQPEWIEAMLIAQHSLKPRNSKVRYITWGLIALALCLGASWGAVLLLRRRSRANSIEQQCLELSKATDMKAQLCWNDYTLFRDACNARLSGIVDKLEQRGLSEREIRIAVLVLIGFSYAEMADILFRAESGIGKDKYTIAKRLGVSAKELRETLISIAKSHV